MARLPLVVLPPSAAPETSAKGHRGGGTGGTPAAWRRYEHVIRHSEVEGARGGYAGWLTKVASQTLLEQQDHPALAGILTFLDRGGPMADYERLVAGIIRPGSGVRQTVEAHQDRRRELILKEGGILQQSKLRELWDERLMILGVAESRSLRRRRGSQFDAYLDDPSTCDLLTQIDRNSRRLCDPRPASATAARRRHLLKNFLSWIPDPASLTSRDVAQAFRLLRDPFSLKIAEAIENEAFVLRVLPWIRFEKEVGEAAARVYRRPADPRTENARYFCAGRIHAKGVMFVRSRPLGLQDAPSPEDLLFEVLALIVHEYQHHLDMDPAENRPASALFRLELKAHAREFLWRALYGDANLLREYAGSAAGFALHFRDAFEDGPPSVKPV